MLSYFVYYKLPSTGETEYRTRTAAANAAQLKHAMRLGVLPKGATDVRYEEVGPDPKGVKR